MADGGGRKYRVSASLRYNNMLLIYVYKFHIQDTKNEILAWDPYIYNFEKAVRKRLLNKRKLKMPIWDE